MEEYLQNLKSLRSQMNDIEEDAEKRSVEEQKQRTAIEAMEKDLILVRAESKRLNNEAREMVNEKVQICCQITEKQQKLSAMEAESATLSQTLELLKQEINVVSARLEEKRLHYATVLERLDAQLRDQQSWWFKSHNEESMEDIRSNADVPVKPLDYDGNASKTCSTETNLENMKGDETNGRHSDLVNQLESAKTKLSGLMSKKFQHDVEISKSKQLMEQLKQRIDAVPPEVKAMGMKALEDEHKALLKDKAEENEFLQSLHDQIKQLEGISHVVKCQCGEEYRVGLMV